MNNLSSYCGLVDAKIRASDRDLPVFVKTNCVHWPCAAYARTAEPQDERGFLFLGDKIGMSRDVF